MLSEKRLVDLNSVIEQLENEWGYEGIREDLYKLPTVDAVVLPHPPRPVLKDCNPYNTDVYCPECGTNLSGYYGDEPLPFVTCFNCGEILDPKKSHNKDGRRE